MWPPWKQGGWICPLSPHLIRSPPLPLPPPLTPFLTPRPNDVQDLQQASMQYKWTKGWTNHVRPTFQNKQTDKQGMKSEEESTIPTPYEQGNAWISGRKEGALNGGSSCQGWTWSQILFCVDVIKNKDSKFLFFLDVIICS